MTHDPVCPWGQAFGHLHPCEPGFYCCQDCNPGMTDPDTVTCQCDLIAKVRADERQQTIRDCIAAVEGLSPWRKTDPVEVENALRDLDATA